MKRVVRPRVIDKYVDILVSIDDYQINDDIAAYTPVKLKHPSVKKDEKMSDQALDLYQMFIECVLEVIEGKGLKITKNYPSGKSEAYYIDVEHVGYVDDVRVKYMIHFRIGDHVNKNINNQKPKFSGDTIETPVIKQIRIGSYTFSAYTKAMVYLNKLCIGIRNDDPEYLESETKYFD